MEELIQSLQVAADAINSALELLTGAAGGGAPVGGQPEVDLAAMMPVGAPGAEGPAMPEEEEEEKK